MAVAPLQAHARIPWFSSFGGRRLAVPVALAALSLWLISRWAQVWWADPDLGHGWLVPLLAALLVRERWADRPAAPSPSPATMPARWPWLLLALPVAGALAASRLLLEPFPRWPLILWVFSALCYGLILALLAATGGVRLARHFVMPLVFTATALPWPGIIDHEVILPLRAGLALVAAEIANIAGYPAIAHGTVVEIGRGVVGVDEACSGVRSLQTALAVSLFQGELYRLSGLRRLALLGVGLAFALGTNLARTVFLSLQGAWHGAEGVERWHDGAGMVQLIVCLGGLLFVGWRWSRHGVPSAPSPAASLPATPTPTPTSTAFAPRLAAAILAFILVLETGTQGWFNQGARAQREFPQWEVNLPAHRPDFKAQTFTASMQAMLGCDAHQRGQWLADDGTPRSGYIIEWNQGQTARFSPSLHDPTICLPMSGSALVADNGLRDITIGELTFPFRAYTFSLGDTAYHVFYLAWDLTTNRPLQRGAEIRAPLDWFAQQWQDVRAGRRDLRARVIGLAIHGAPNLAAARTTLEIELGQLLHPPPPATAPTLP